MYSRKHSSPRGQPAYGTIFGTYAHVGQGAVAKPLECLGLPFWHKICSCAAKGDKLYVLALNRHKDLFLFTEVEENN